ELAGRKVRCPDCKQVLTVPRPQAEEEIEALDLLLADEPPAARPARRPEPDDAVFDRKQVRRPPPVPPPPVKEPFEPPRPRARERKRKRPERSGGGIAVNAEIITGILMMVGAAVWFFLGLAAGFIYFYPPILFVLGIAAVVRGFTGGG